MNHTINELRKTASVGETPKVRAYLEAHPGWADEPATSLILAGFSNEEFAYLADLSLVQPRAELVTL
ncbi:hypothetical protein E3T61_18495 [Cryobacterium lactosi]|uniref:Uncharacterized protein n=1 Tax=Cryobacterium lactosi TaxID=1259202 RepID=A0A4R9BIQ7_9MICO|nr:hypothetical protein [Cryobacterium lactosi]TFD85010.1 hypothetical protein E3T61_18495 [Cryobacterium lactosi]